MTKTVNDLPRGRQHVWTCTLVVLHANGYKPFDRSHVVDNDLNRTTRWENKMLRAMHDLRIKTLQNWISSTNRSPMTLNSHCRIIILKNRRTVLTRRSVCTQCVFARMPIVSSNWWKFVVVCGVWTSIFCYWASECLPTCEILVFHATLLRSNCLVANNYLLSRELW